LKTFLTIEAAALQSNIFQSFDILLIEQNLQYHFIMDLQSIDMVE